MTLPLTHRPRYCFRVYEWLANRPAIVQLRDDNYGNRTRSLFVLFGRCATETTESNAMHWIQFVCAIRSLARSLGISIWSIGTMRERDIGKKKHCIVVTQSRFSRRHYDERVRSSNRISI